MTDTDYIDKPAVFANTTAQAEQIYISIPLIGKVEGLVSLFNVISILFRLFNAKAILPEEQ